VLETSLPRIQLLPDLPLGAAAHVYATAGRVHLPMLFPPEIANGICQRLLRNTPWRLVYNEGSVHKEVSLAEFKSMGERAYLDLLEVVNARGRTSFQYIYRSYPIYDQFILERSAGDPYLMQLVEFLNSSAFLEAMRRLTGERSIEVVDANATLYECGHFLTRHDDKVEGKNRVAAYVVNLTPMWSADWGGILTFHAPDGHVVEGYVPTFNAINIFRVPQLHAVSYVSPLAAAGRFSIAGWLRRAA
jgi:SM-20-related protein